MKTAITLLLILPCVLFSQIRKSDTVNMPVEVQASVKNIVLSQQKQKALTERIDAELEKQMKLLQEIKKEIEKLKTTARISADKKEKISTILSSLQGIRTDEYDKLLEDPEVKWEQRPKSWFGRLFSSQKYRLFPYIYSPEDSAIIYLPKK